MKAVIANMPPHWLAEQKASPAAQWDEMWEGVLHVPPMPNRFHQNIARDLTTYLHQWWAKPRGGQANQEVNLTTPQDEVQWTKNYRIPDIVLLDRARLHIDKIEYMVGAPLVVVEVASPGDETYDKFPFYAGLGVPEVWVVHRDSRVPEVHALGPGPAYTPLPPGPDGWVRSPATGVELRPTGSNTLGVRIAGDPATAAELPDA